MTNVPDINLMRETAEGITNEHRDNFSKSDEFKKMCSEIQDKANKGEFVISFNSGLKLSQKDLHSAKKLFDQHGYQTQLAHTSLIVSWGRVYTEIEE